MLEALDRLRSQPLETPEDAELAEEAARLSRDILAVRRRAERFVADANARAQDRRATPLRGVPLHEAARRVLAEAGVPLHARELGRRIKAAGWRHPRSRVARPDQIVFQLAARLPRHPDVFRRVAPNTFALVEWGPEPFRAKRRAPRLGTFSGPGEAIGARIGESDEPVTEGSAWRSS